MKYRILHLGIAYCLGMLFVLAPHGKASCAVSSPLSRPTMPTGSPAVSAQKNAVLLTLDDALTQGYSLLKSGRSSDAVKEFSKVLEGDKHNCRAMVGIALCHEAQGQWVLACNELQDASLWNPRNPYAIINYLDCSSRINRLSYDVPVVRRLCNTSSKDAADICRTVAQYLAEKDYWAAQWFAQKAHTLDPKTYPTSDVIAKPLKTTSGRRPIFPNLVGQINPWENSGNQFEYGGGGGAFPNNYGNSSIDQYPWGYNEYNNPFGSYGQSTGNSIWDQRVMPFNGGVQPYQSYPIAPGLNYVPPYNGPIPRR